MREELTTVHLVGILGEEFGHVWKLKIRTAAEAVRAINYQRPGFAQRLIDLSAESKMRFRVKNDGVALQKEMLNLPAGEDIAIIPIPEGRAGAKGILTAILGAVLVVVGLVFPVLAFLVPIGASLLLSGVATLLAPSPKQNQNANPDNKPSYLFSGPVNTNQQGGPVPVLYGRLPIGGVVISATLEAREFLPTSSPLNGGTSNAGGVNPALVLYAQ